MPRFLRVCFEILAALVCECLALVATGLWLTGVNGVHWSTPFGYGSVGALLGVLATVESIEGLYAFVDSLTGPPRDM